MVGANRPRQARLDCVGIWRPLNAIRRRWRDPATPSGVPDSMTLAFAAKSVSCTDAIGGDLLQVIFDTVPENDNDDTRRSPYLEISRLFEFPGPATVEWHDGNDYGGGGRIVSLNLMRDRLFLKLKRDLDFDVSFSLSDRKFSKLVSFLRTMIGDDRVFVLG